MSPLAGRSDASARAERPDAQPLTVARLLRTYAPEFVTAHPRQAAPQVQSTLAKLSLCRTATLGGRVLACQSCDHRRVVYNSCGDRHCPQCRGARRAEWIDATGELLLPGVDYFQVVFTLPAQLSALALGNRKPVYDLLFTAAWQALREVIEQECGFVPAALMVLHTWNQRLEHHPHLHALVPGGGPSPAGDRWINSRHPTHRRRQKPYLVDNRKLSRRFRDLFLAGLMKLHRQAALCTEDDALRRLTTDLSSRDWVVFIEAPPHENASPQNVLKYLARYLTGGPISDRRLIAAAGDKVTFTARSGEKPTDGKPPRQIPVTLAACEFVRRWALHILPKGFTKVRSYGGYSNRHRQTYLDRSRQLLGAAPHDNLDNVPAIPPDASGDDDASVSCCPRCHGPMECLTETNRPSWFDIMTGPFRPFWYRDG